MKRIEQALAPAPPAAPDIGLDLAGMTPSSDAALRARLLARVQASVRAQRGYTTVRRERGGWQALAPGASRRVLWQGPWLRAEAWRLDAGAALPWPGDASAQEALLLAGALCNGTARLERLDHLVHERATRLVLRADEAGAEVYLRQRLAPLDALQAAVPLEARWWRLSAGSARIAPAQGRRWHDGGRGVRVARLAGDADVVSMLVRFDAGASVPDHHHAIDEDCLVIDGEMFLGDVLLRQGDFQLAPAGGGHWGETSDVGCLFYFHGAIDPALKPGR
jgi:mannose-6-phosphate isomerase-like protein (cupin superfamily)